MLKSWILPALGALFAWGFWAFLPKLTTRYLEPRSAVVYEVIGAVAIVSVFLATVKFPVQTHPQGIPLALCTGVLGFLGSLCFLTAVSRGPIALVAPLSSLYPVVSILLAVLLLHESLTLRQGVGILLAVIAMILVAV